MAGRGCKTAASWDGGIASEWMTAKRKAGARDGLSRSGRRGILTVCVLGARDAARGMSAHECAWGETMAQDDHNHRRRVIRLLDCFSVKHGYNDSCSILARQS